MLRALSLPLEIIKSPGRFLSGVWQDGGRGQFLVMGVPSAIIAGLILLAALMAYSNDNDLRARYSGLAQVSRDKAADLRKELIGETGSANLDSIPKDDERKKALDFEVRKEQMFLQKLINLEKDNPEHKFELAQLAFLERNPQLGESLLEVIAPFEEPGYAKAHITLAEIFMFKAMRSRSDNEKRTLLAGADKQISNAIIADEGNPQAKLIKARLLTMSRNYLQAYNRYQELFETDPIHYREMLKLSRILGDKQKEQKVLDRAASEYRQRTQRDLENVSEWVSVWDNYIVCLKLLKQFNTAETAVSTELKKHRGDIGKEVFLKQQLSRIYTERVIKLGRTDDPQIQVKQLSDLQKSLENDRKNEAAMQWLTVLGNSPHVGEAARKIYDPQYDPNTPWIVLSELGHNALAKKDYENAITYFERARRKKPTNPQVLNNLAYSYLVSPDSRNPEQALLLVDQAILNIKNQDLGVKRGEIISSFFDTRGEALIQLDRMKDAAAALEIAYRARPDSLNILEKLMKCYQASGNKSQFEQIRRRLERLRTEKARSE